MVEPGLSVLALADGCTLEALLAVQALQRESGKRDSRHRRICGYFRLCQRPHGASSYNCPNTKVCTYQHSP